jgi:Pyruvate/2-oxoacid:ferredoxin oxidoreductase delta subunit
MSQKTLTVVISQAQGRNPVKRALEDTIATALLDEPGISVTLVPHLYDMNAEHSGSGFLREVQGDLIVLGWLYERAMRWTLDRSGVRGHAGETQLRGEDDDDEDEDQGDPPAAGIGVPDLPDRHVWCLDLRISSEADDYLQEIRRIRDSLNPLSNPVSELMSWINGSPSAEQLQRYLDPDRMLNARRAFDSGNASQEDRSHLPEDTGRRWYPVIDYSRCTNCMECIDFCLFGVYGVDSMDRILVEQQDSCKKGCPACSRVCPADAIIFPQHKEAAIAGSDGDVGGLRIDLTKLFGGTDEEDALEKAVRERDQELILDGREAVGMSVGIRRKHREEMENLLSDLDSLAF